MSPSPANCMPDENEAGTYVETAMFSMIESNCSGRQLSLYPASRNRHRISIDIMANQAIGKVQLSDFIKESPRLEYELS